MLLLLPRDVLRTILAITDDLSKMVLKETCRVLYLLSSRLTNAQKYKAVERYIFQGNGGTLIKFLYYRRKDVLAKKGGI
jgi:hypothetical protein